MSDYVWSKNARECLSEKTLKQIGCLIDVSKAARVLLNHDGPKGSILLPLAVKRLELTKALAALDKSYERT